MGFLANLRNTVQGMTIGARMGAEDLMLTRDFVEEALEDRDRGVASGRRSQESLVGNTDIFTATESAALAELELAIDDQGWRDMSSPYGNWNFSRWAVMKMINMARVMYLMNPLIRRAITVQELYVWGSGCAIKAKSKPLQKILDDFFQDPKNQKVIGAAWPEREREQRIEGNTFFLLFINRMTGQMRIRLLPPEQVHEIITNPDDMMDVWYYKRLIPTGDPSDMPPQMASDAQADGGQYVLYPSIDYEPYPVTPSSFKDVPIKWSARVLHVKTGSLSGMKYGLPELLSAHNWATAYKKFLENFATLMQAYARWAVRISGNPGKQGTAAAKSKLNTAINGNSQTIDKNPPSNTASIFAASGASDVSAIKTRGSTTAPDEARALRTMVAAGTDTPEHFFGDAELGKLATAKTLDRPTELKMVARQTMWEEVILKICRKLEEWSTRAPMGELRDAGWTVKSTRDPFDGSTLFTITPPEPKPVKDSEGNVIPTSGKENDIEVRFPAIIQADIVDRVRAVVQAATLGGRKAEGIIRDRKFLFKLLMIALGYEKPEEITDEMYPNSTFQGFADPEFDQETNRIKADAAAAGPEDTGGSGSGAADE